MNNFDSQIILTQIENPFRNNNEMITVSKKIKIWKFPSILMITLKRFDLRMRKNNQLVTFPVKDLDLSKYCSDYNSKSPKVFDLIGVCNHSGNLCGGHYYAYCLCDDNQWREFNDSSVTNMDESDVVTNSAYVLFYRVKSD